jgi:hypothetical protein
MADEYRYYAFISYSSEDRAWADWFRYRLEKYHIPRRIEGFKGEPPRHFYPIFQDREHLRASSSLDEILKEALRQSRFLIVVCSPFAAVSKWVNQEIHYFKSLNRSDCILPVVVEGRPSAGPGEPEACFPPELRMSPETEDVSSERKLQSPGAADARPDQDGREHALLRIIAGLLAVDVTAVARRERWRRLARRAWMALTGKAWIGGYDRLQVDFYRTYMERWGIPEGRLPLNAESRSHCDSCRFERRRGKLLRVQIVGPNGRMYSSALRTDVAATQIQFHYRENGRLGERLFLDRFGKVLLTEEFSEDMSIVTLRHASNLPAWMQSQSSPESVFTGADALEAQTNPLRYNTRIARMQWQYDSAGFRVRALTQNVFGGPAVGGDGTWGASYEYDADANLSRITNLGSTGAPSVDNHGVASVWMKYDARRCLVEKVNVDADGKPVIAAEGYARTLNAFDSESRCIRSEYFDPAGERMMLPAGHSLTEFTYDTRGFMKSVSFFDVNSQLSMQKEGYALRQLEKDARGWIARMTHFDVHGAPCLNASGYTSVTFERDENDNPVHVRYFGLCGEPVASEGVYEIYRRFDSYGNSCYEEYRNARGELTPGKNGFAAMEHRYDSQNRVVEIRYLDTLRQLTIPVDGCGAAVRRRRYSEDGKSIAETVFNAEGRPTPGKFGAYEACVTFSAFGLPEEVTAFGMDGVPTLNCFGFHKAIYYFNSTGHPTGIAWFGTQGEPVIQRRDNVHRLRDKYNSLGLLISETTYDVSDKPTASKNGFAEFRYRYDNRGWRIADDFFDANGQPTVNSDGVAGIRYTFDARRNIVEQVTLGVDGKSVAGKDGYALLKAVFNERNQVVAISMFDSDARPTVCAKGFHQAALRYDVRGNVVEQTWFGVDGKRVFAKFPIAQSLGEDEAVWANQVAYVSSLRYEYDAVGHMLCTRAFGLGHEPVLGLAGAHKIEFSYNEKSICNGARFFDADGAPIISLLGFAGYQSYYDDRWLLCERRYFGPDRKLMLHIDSDYGLIYAAFRISFDDHGRPDTTTFLDTELKPFLTNLQASSVRKRYDARGNEVEHQFLGLDGQPIDSSQGCATLRAEYDVFDHMVRQSQYDAKGRIIPIARNHFSTAYKRNFAGQTIEMTYLDSQGALGQDDYGVARAEYEYDSRGLDVERRLFDSQNKLVVGEHGFAKCRAQYNEAGQMVDRQFFAATGKISSNPLLGYAEEKHRYDHLRRPIEVWYSDAEGNLVNAKNGLARLTHTYSPGCVETMRYDAAGDWINGTEGWARRVYLDGVNGEPNRQLMYDAQGHALVGALAVANCGPVRIAQRLGLQAGDVILKLGDWSARCQGEFNFQWRTLCFFTGRVSSFREEEGVILREGKTLRIMFSPGPIDATLRDTYLRRDQLEVLEAAVR